MKCISLKILNVFPQSVSGPLNQLSVCRPSSPVLEPIESNPNYSTNTLSRANPNGEIVLKRFLKRFIKSKKILLREVNEECTKLKTQLTFGNLKTLSGEISNPGSDPIWYIFQISDVVCKRDFQYFVSDDGWRCGDRDWIDPTCAWYHTQSLKQRRISWGGIFEWKFKFNFPPDEVAGQTSTTLIITKPSIIVLVFTLHYQYWKFDQKHVWPASETEMKWAIS